MLSQGERRRYADVLLWALRKARKSRLKKGDIILVRYDRAAIEMAEVLQERLLGFGLQPVLRFGGTAVMERNFYTLSNLRQLVFEPPGDRELYQRLSGAIYLHAPESLTHLKDVDPKRIGKVALARKPLRDILDRRDEQGLFGWSLCLLPTHALAKEAGLSPRQYTREILKACFLNTADPVQRWDDIYEEASRIKRWLNRLDMESLHIRSENVDLHIRPGRQRKWVGISGHNIPSFEIFLSPDWRGTEGTYYADQPSYRSGNRVRGVRLIFRRGLAVQAEADEGETFLNRQIAMDPGARRTGEFSLTDRRFSMISRFMANTLYDENYGGRHGNCHLALGASYSDTFTGDPKTLSAKRKKDLGFNESALHWDLVNTEDKRVTARLSSGKTVLIYENGSFAH